MNWIKIYSLAFLCAIASLVAVPVVAQNQNKPPAPTPAPSQSGAPSPAPATKAPDHASSYYHLAMAHMYEEMMGMYGRAEYATKAIEEYRLAIEADPSSEYLSN